MQRLVIIVNGLLPDSASARALIIPGDAVLAVDGGTRHARALGMHPRWILGDMDSLLPADRDWARQNNVDFLAYPRDKNETDLELALCFAIEQGYKNLLILAALGGRLDQSLANIALLTDPALADVDIRLADGREQAWFVRKQTQIRGEAGDTISLLPWGGTVTGVTTQGLRWRLHGEDLFPHHTRGISNELLASDASISIKNGLLLVIQRSKKSETEVP